MVNWILAFDAECSTCSDAAERVRIATGDRLTVAGLEEESIRRTRRLALGENPPWAPTLLAVDGDRVRAWTGARLSVRLAWLLGPARSVRVARALAGSRALAGPPRRSVLRVVPGAALGAFLISGGLVTPASAAGRRTESACQKARKWAAANKHNLPTNYDEVVSHSMVYRKAIFAESTPEVRGQLLATQLQRYQTRQAGLSAAQRQLLDRAITMVRWVHRAGPSKRTTAALKDLKSAMIGAFGAATAQQLLATLGPVDPRERTASVSVQDTCPCSSWDSWCDAPTTCTEYVPPDCSQTSFGCGSALLQPCDGRCR